uniref:Uncharacterized protein n=1 Tax=Rhizophora mucronata TaxID=61149 RepID=A0A2P2R3T5_RHIMU
MILKLSLLVANKPIITTMLTTIFQFSLSSLSLLINDIQV